MRRCGQASRWPAAHRGWSCRTLGVVAVLGCVLPAGLCQQHEPPRAFGGGGRSASARPTVAASRSALERDAPGAARRTGLAPAASRRLMQQEHSSVYACPEGFTGGACEPCSKNIFALTCQLECDMFVNCSGHGRCDGLGGGCSCYPGWRGEACDEARPLPECGDGIVEFPEVCDNGCVQQPYSKDYPGCPQYSNLQDPTQCNPAQCNQCPPCIASDGDGCSDTCELECGYSCSAESGPSDCEIVSQVVCGDGLRAGLEWCDDGNTVDGDGCSATCHVEQGWSCTISLCSKTRCFSTCGDGVAVGTEECDDGNARWYDGCSQCTVDAGFNCSAEVNGDQQCVPVCGDGIISVFWEGCDDGNERDGDGCSSSCTIEDAWTCSRFWDSESVCEPTCGDGLIRGWEQCDDGNTLSNDGCSAFCTPEDGWECTSGTCTPTCGDGLRTGFEWCDDGNSVSGDGCSALCSVEPGYVCWGAEPFGRAGGPSDLCEIPFGDDVCGSGIMPLGTRKECDDGNTVGGDGCSPLCRIECGWVCGAFTVSELTFTASDMTTAYTVTDVTFAIYSNFPESYGGCRGGDCGWLIASSQGVARVRTNERYLIVASRQGYYEAYKEIWVDSVMSSLSFEMVEEMSTNQDRVVLSWDYGQDLDLWVYDKADRSNKVGWNVAGRSDSFAGGQITLDVDNWDGMEGPETTQFRNLASGTVEVWVNHYDDTFTQSLVASTPATVDIFCYRCLDDDNEVKVGFVRSVTQAAGDVPSGGRNWWKVGAFVAPGGSERVKWTTCAWTTATWTRRQQTSARRLVRMANQCKLRLIRWTW